jgi:hypothetical protein
MADPTSNYGLQTLGPGEPFSTNGYKYVNADRHTIDNLLKIGAETHVHDGLEGSAIEPDEGPELVLDVTAGTLPAGTRIYYKYTLVNAQGQETIPSTESFIDTPAAVETPAAPTVFYESTGGTLQPGNYYYSLSAYVNASISETKAENPVHISVAVTSLTNVITIGLPTLPDGADGFNVYRRKPGQSKYFYLDSIDMTGATPTDIYVDDGSVGEDCDRGLPRYNTTNTTNTVTISLPASAPLEEGYTWKIYRTYVNGGWDSSFLTHIVEYVSEATPTIIDYYDDIGLSTSEGTYPTATLVTDSPSKIDLTDSAHVTGYLPLGMTAFPFVVSFRFSGALSVQAGTEQWVCEFPAATIIGCRAYMDAGDTPGGATPTDIVVDVNIYNEFVATPAYETIYTTQANRPKVLVGQTVGDRTIPDTLYITGNTRMTVDIDQVGGGSDLTVHVYMIASAYPFESHVPGTLTGSGAI